MKEAKLYKKLDGSAVQCLACNHKCIIPEGKTGICGARKNIKGKLYSLVHSRVAALHIEPIEKKPFFHFLPGSLALSLGTFGCNFACKFCQNNDISQTLKEKNLSEQEIGEFLPPKKIIEYAKQYNIPTIAYTYNEPTVFVEYAYETMKLAKENGLKNVWVSNGFFSKDTLDLITPYLDAINIDIKSFSKDFYQKIINARIEPVKENIKEVYKRGIWLELTTLVIPGYNDSKEELFQIAKFIKDISPNIPWHISRFFPAYKMTNIPPTPKQTLLNAYKIGKEVGLNYVYLGNMPNSKYESTYCPRCKRLLIERLGFEILANYLEENKCPDCQEKIPGIFN